MKKQKQYVMFWIEYLNVNISVQKNVSHLALIILNIVLKVNVLHHAMKKSNIKLWKWRTKLIEDSNTYICSNLWKYDDEDKSKIFCHTGIECQEGHLLIK